MKVWILFVSDEFDSKFYGVFSSEEKVDAVLDKYLDENPDASARYWEETIDIKEFSRSG